MRSGEIRAWTGRMPLYPHRAFLTGVYVHCNPTLHRSATGNVPRTRRSQQERTLGVSAERVLRMSATMRPYSPSTSAKMRMRIWAIVPWSSASSLPSFSAPGPPAPRPQGPAASQTRFRASLATHHAHEKPRLLRRPAHAGIADDADRKSGRETGEADRQAGAELDEAGVERHRGADCARRGGR